MRRLRVLLLVVGVLVAGCSDDSASVDPEPDTGSGDAAEPSDTENGGGSGGAAFDNDFPIPAPIDPVVVVDSIPGNLTVDYAGDRFAEIVAFYEAWIADQPFEFSATPADVSAGVTWFSLPLEGEPGYGLTITVAPDVGPDDNVGVSLNAVQG